LGYGIDVSVILCAYNEGNVIGDAIDKVDFVMMKTGWSYEIIVVDDGSLDDTRQKVVQYMDEKGNGCLKVVGYGKNMGKGNAIIAGFAHAEGDFVVFIDSDLDVDPKLIPSYVEALKTSDVAVASKWHRQSHTVVTLKRKVLSFGFNLLSRLLTGIKLKDTQTGLKAFRRGVLERMAPKFVVKRYAFDLELMSACNHCGFKIVDLPVDVHIKDMVSFKEIFRMTLDMFQVAYRLRILKYYQRS
jgi:glycosyltransferase involved in cell wall biosynthesis